MSVKETFPFDEAFQEAVVGHCLISSKFFFKCYGKIRPQWFSKNVMLGSIYNQLCNRYRDEGTFIASIQEFKNYAFFLEQTLTDQERYYQLIDKCALLSAKNFSISNLERQLTGFLRVSLFKESIEGAAARYKSIGFDDAYKWTQQKIIDINNASFEDNEFVVDFKNPMEWIKKQEDRKSNAISTGSKKLDIALGGGLFKKETCAFMAPSNVGKTTGMITIARHAIMQRKNVIFLIHEGDPEEIRFRILCSLMGITSSTLFDWMKDSEKRKQIFAASNILDRHLTYVPYIKTNSMFVEDVVALIKKLNEEKKTKTGQGYDIVIDDYPKKLKSRLRSGSKEGLYRTEVAEIYDTFNHLATEMDVHCFLAIQTNRNGLKQNNGRMESAHLLGMEEIDESYGVAQNLANIITLNRGPEDRKHNIIRMNIAKSRNHETDITVNTRTKYDCFLLFADQEMLPSFSDIPGNFLASYIQNDNAKRGASEIHAALRDEEDKHANIPQDASIGVANMKGKLDI